MQWGLLLTLFLSLLLKTSGESALISRNFSGLSVWCYWKVQCLLGWFDWKNSCCWTLQKASYLRYIFITLNTEKTALPVLLYLYGNNWSLVFTTSAGWVTTDAMMPANAPQVNVSNELSSGVPSSDRQETLIKHLFKVWYKAIFFWVTGQRPTFIQRLTRAF